jgi:hypothetical protein
MVRNYIKKGGHGGKRVRAGLESGHWEQQGGRKAAAEAEHQRKVAALLKKKADADAAKARWRALCIKKNPSEDAS